ncbi:MAG: hypothetical protein ACP5RT_02745 [Candidatus Micrarchaeia archaeon]
MNKVEIAAGIIIILLVVGIVAYMNKFSSVPPITTSAARNMSVLTFQLTDPPEVPNGTQSLTIGYSSINTHLVFGNGSGSWISAEGSGTINLLSLVNMSQVIGRAYIPANATVDEVKFTITNATITINNVVYNVTVPNNQISVHITNANKVNGTSSAVIDMTPVIATIYTNTSTTFVLVPSLRAIVVGGSSSTVIGTKTALNKNVTRELRLLRPNISISSVTLSEVGNSTHFSIDILNNGNQSVKIKHVLLFGNESINVNAGIYGRMKVRDGKIYIGENENYNSNVQEQDPPGFGGGASIAAGGLGANAILNSTISSGINSSTISGIINKTMGNSGVINSSVINNALNSLGNMNESEIANISQLFNITINATNMNKANFTKLLRKIHSLNISEGELHDFLAKAESNPAFNAIANSFGLSNEEDLINVSINAEHFRVMDFFVGQNGTLMLPFEEKIAVPNANISSEFEEGDIVQAHSNAVLSFNGPISFANGHITIVIIPGDNYKVVVMGEEGARSSANVTAS